MGVQEFDIVVLGAGPTGEVCAGRLAEGGLSVAIVEEHLVGGECSFYACMPSKGLLRPGQALAEARRVPGAAEAATGTLDPAAALARRDEIVHDLDDAGQLPWLESVGVELFRGRGRLDGERRVAVGDVVLAARRAVVVATGSEPRRPPIEGLADVAPWDNREGTTAKAVPSSLVVLGGGPQGVELAQAWQSLGSRVTLVEGGEHVLSREEAFAAEEVEQALRDAGVTLRTGVHATRASRAGRTVTLELDDGTSVEGAELMLGLGRTPRTREIGVETVGLEPGDPIATDPHLRSTTQPWLYAIGDANGRALLTHEGKYQARVATDHILGRANDTLAHDGALAARVVFTEPQVAAVGHTLRSAQEAGLHVRAVDSDVNDTAGGSFFGRGVPGKARIVVDEDRRVLIGATFTGAEIADLLHSATIAIVGEVPIDRLWHAVPSFPTRSEVWLKLLEAYGL